MSSSTAVPEQPKPVTWRRRVLRWCRRLSLLVLGFAALYFLAVWILGWLSVNGDYVQADEGIEIRVWDHGVHTDFLIPVRSETMDWGEFAPLEGADPTAGMSYLLIGWGDHDFYIDTPTYDDFSLARTAKAVFLPTRTVMHVKYFDELRKPEGSCVKLILTKAEYGKLIAYMKASFRLDAAGEPMVVEGKSYGPDDVFYHAIGTYHLFDTCNNWANTALKRAGVKTAVWSPFGYAMIDQLKQL
jgi:uncharacterized protein (TIGR02117 family)